MIEAIQSAYRNYASFSGRATRGEYWWFWLYTVLGTVFFALLTQIADILAVLYVAFWAANIIPSIALMVRRLHDSNKSGWWLLLSFVPFGGIVVFVFLILDSTPGPNRFGPGRGNAAWAYAQGPASWPSQQAPADWYPQQAPQQAPQQPGSGNEPQA